ALADRLLAVLAGTARPADTAEGLALARMAYDTRRYAAAARLWSDALAADPKLGQDRLAQHRYSAACAAARAGTGQGTDDAEPEVPTRARLRGQALDWMKAELTAWTRLLESGPPQLRSDLVQTLQHWTQDPDLASIRDAEPLARLPADEQKAWRTL